MRYLPAHAVSSHDQRYAYASGRIRALEITLLGKQRLDRIAEAADLNEVLRLLSDTAYAIHLDEIEENGYEVFLQHEERRLFDLVDSLSLDRGVSDILKLGCDYHNLKVALREKVSERDLGDLYMDLGRFEPAEIREPVMSETLDALPDIFVDAAKDALAAYGESRDPAVADMIVDRAMFAHFLRVAGGYGGPFMKAIVRTWIDLANIRTFLRARYLGLEARHLPEMMIDGGLVRLSDLYETYQFTLDEIMSRFEFSPYRRVIEIGGVAGEKEGSFVPLEREIDNALLSLLRITRYFTFGLEVVISYALVKQIEIKALRLVLAGKERGMAPDAIKERIPDAE
jgi:V/A-type H+-transporting ATPase subunit C